MSRNRVLRVFEIVAVLYASAPAWAAEDRAVGNPRRTPVVEAYERVRDSVVNISTTQKVQTRHLVRDVFGFPDFVTVPSERTSVGSGFVIHPEGYIATNAHVVSAGNQLAVTFADGGKHEAVVIGRDSAKDLAVIKIEPERPLKPIVFGRSDDLMIGETTIAIGNPVGLQNTLTTGVVSALHRELNVDGRVIYKDVIQTDASINPGNSGGPLLNVLGELIGVNTAVRTDAQNIGFAIPVDQLKDILPEILDSEKLNDVQVGLRLGETIPVRIVSIREESPAAKAGLKLGDVVTEVDGRPLRDPLDFYVSMLSRRAQEVVAFKLIRDGKPLEKKLALSEVPKPDARQLAMQKLGVGIEDVSEATARRYRSKRHGVRVVSVEPRGPANRADIRPGDLIISMNQYYIRDEEHVGALLAGTRTNDPVDVGFHRRSSGLVYHDEVRLYAR